MRFKLLVFGILISIITIVIIGVYALNINNQILLSFEKGEKHFKVITSAAAEVSSYAKRAEGHLFMYLALHRNTDKEKVPLRIASLHENISILDLNIKLPKAKALLEKIKTNAEDILSASNTLIAHHDNAIKDNGKFEIEKHRDVIIEQHDAFSAVRKNGVSLVEFELQVEADLKSTILENAARLRLNLSFLITLLLVFTIYLSYILSRMINALNNEIASRIQSEKATRRESDKLKEALTKVKVLSGMVPICATCKNIRDDQGYWKQIESYIRDHSEMQFSHGICPDCLKLHYPDYDDEDGE